MGSRQARSLGDFERTQFLTGEVHPFNLVLCLRLAERLSEDALATALRRLQRRHALLRCRIAVTRGRPRFELDKDRPPIPVRKVERAGEETWRGEVEDELGHSLDSGCAPLLRCCHVTGGQASARSELVFTFHHAIVDAVAATLFLRGVLTHASSADEPPRRTDWTSSIPESVDERLPSSFRGLSVRWSSGRFMARQMAGEIEYRWRRRRVEAKPPPGPFQCRILPILYGVDETEKLVRATRRKRVSVWSTLNAAMLLAVVARRYPNSALPHRYLSFPLLRSYLQPPVSDEVMASYFSILRRTVPADTRSSVWELAAEIHRQSDDASKGGERFFAARWGEFSMKALLRQKTSRMSTVALNYIGAVDLTHEGAQLEVEGLHAFVSNFPLGPEYTAQARIFRRRLWLDILYLDSDMQEDEARTIADDMRHRLVDAALEAS